MSPKIDAPNRLRGIEPTTIKVLHRDANQHHLIHRGHVFRTPSFEQRETVSETRGCLYREQQIRKPNSRPDCSLARSSSASRTLSDE
jgi:hypothetical protein